MDLDIRNPDMLLVLLLIWFSYMLESQTIFVDRLIVDSASPKRTSKPPVIFVSAEQDDVCTTSVLQ